MTECFCDQRGLKAALRAQAQAARRALADKDDLSRLIWERFFSLPDYLSARTVMAYLNLPSEVRTQPYVWAVQEQGRQVVVPYCEGDELGLFRLDSMHELAAGTLGILEPRIELRARAERRVEVAQLDLILVPGVAFDRRGGRLGHGKGYYDRLLRRARRDTPLVGLAFECQLVPAVPMLPHDVPVDKLVTEEAVYVNPRRRGQPLTAP